MADEGSRKLYDRVLGAFRARGFTLARWCKENDVAYGTARNALIGASGSWAAGKLRDKIVKEARL